MSIPNPTKIQKYGVSNISPIQKYMGHVPWFSAIFPTFQTHPWPPRNRPVTGRLNIDALGTGFAGAREARAHAGRCDHGSHEARLVRAMVCHEAMDFSMGKARKIIR